MTPPPPPARRSPANGAGASTRERLLAAAREVVAKEGLEGLTLRAIARHAGVSHGAPLRHFPTLASLLAAVAAGGFDRLVEEVDSRLAAADAAAAAEGRVLPADVRLALAGDAYVDVALADPGVFSITFRAERCDVDDAAYMEAGARSFGQLVDLTAAAQAEGWHADVATQHLAAALWASVHGTAELAIHGAFGGILGPDGLAAVRAATTRMLFGPDAGSDAGPGPGHGAGPHPDSGPGPGPDPGPGPSAGPGPRAGPGSFSGRATGAAGDTRTPPETDTRPAENDTRNQPTGHTEGET